MNFFGHATLAAARSPDPAYVLGSMLPDLAPMAGDRLAGTNDDALAAGIAYHHEIDAAFHAAPAFLVLCAAGSEALGEAGVRRGTARAVAHVGIELLLDGWIARTRGISPHYRAALVRGPGLAAALRWRRGPGASRWSALCRRILTSPVPASYDDPDFVVERLVAILSRRPRLALSPRDAAPVARWLREVRSALDGEAAGLVEGVAHSA